MCDIVHLGIFRVVRGSGCGGEAVASLPVLSCSWDRVTGGPRGEVEEGSGRRGHDVSALSKVWAGGSGAALGFRESGRADPLQGVGLLQPRVPVQYQDT